MQADKQMYPYKMISSKQVQGSMGRVEYVDIIIDVGG